MLLPLIPRKTLLLSPPPENKSSTLSLLILPGNLLYTTNMGNIKKLLFTAIIGIGGLLLTLAGLNLIQLSQPLILYTGIVYLLLAAGVYFFL